MRSLSKVEEAAANSVSGGGVDMNPTGNYDNDIMHKRNQGSESLKKWLEACSKAKRKSLVKEGKSIVGHTEYTYFTKNFKKSLPVKWRNSVTDLGYGLRDVDFFVEFDMDFGTKEFEPLLAKFNKMFQKDHGMKLNIHSHESQNDGDVVEFKVTKSGL
jgi:hypothetical protein|tara:strand:+ start:3748 stop:4221 length:474 start_codon:yes stop_codon:yes gene_type:complete